MSEDRFLVTGAMGFIGSWVIRELVKSGERVAAFYHTYSPNRLQLILTPEEQAQVEYIQGDIASFQDVGKAFEDFKPTQLIHLAAMQLPFCKADPVRGAMVNVTGTVNVFEAARLAGLNRVVYASSFAVYDQHGNPSDGKVSHDTPHHPLSHYGVYKEANEGNARIYWQDHRLSSIGIRPYVAYGAGRDQGMTSSPTKAMLAAAFRKPYQITFDGRYGLDYAADAAKVFVDCTRVNFQGADVFNLGGDTVSTTDVIAAIESVAPEMAGKLTYKDTPLPFPAEVDNSKLRQLLGKIPQTPLQQGVGETISIFKQAINDGRLNSREVEKQLA